jgi:hypothetical protein
MRTVRRSAGRFAVIARASPKRRPSAPPYGEDLLEFQPTVSRLIGTPAALGSHGLRALAHALREAEPALKRPPRSLPPAAAV